MKKLSKEEFINRAKCLLGDNYDFTKTTYINAHTRTIITCKKHGDFLAYPTNVLEHNSGCPECAKEKIADFVLDTVEKAKSIIGLENIKPRIIKSSGSSLLEAFDNIKMNSLADANKSLDKEYNDTFEATRDIREKVLASRQQTIIDIDKKSKADNTEFYKGTNYCN